VSSLILEVRGTFLILTGAGLNFELALREFSALVWGEFIELWETNKFCKDLFLGGGGLFQLSGTKTSKGQSHFAMCHLFDGKINKISIRLLLNFLEDAKLVGSPLEPSILTKVRGDWKSP
jgi:hypothetical protein